MTDFTTSGAPNRGFSQLDAYSGQAVVGGEVPLHELGDQDIVMACMRVVKDHEQAMGEWFEEARESYEFRAGHQWSEEDMAVLREGLRPPVTFNQIAPFFDTVAGAQVNNRQETTYFPSTSIDPLDDQKAESLNLIKDWARDRADIEDEESELFTDLLTCGYGWTETRMDYFDDPAGMLVTERFSPFEAFWDPTAKKRNLADAKARGRYKVMPPDEVYALWPDARDKIILNVDQINAADEPVQPNPDSYAYGAKGWGYWQDGQKGIKVYCFEWREILPRWVVQNPDGTTEILSDREWESLQRNLVLEHELQVKAAKMHGIKPSQIPPMQVPKAIKQPQKVWYRAFVAAGQLLGDVKEAPCPHRSSFQVVTGKRDERDNTFYGILRAVKDPQRWANKWLSQSMHILNTSAKGGWLIEEGAVRDIRAFEEEVAKPGSNQIVAPGAIANNRLREKQPPAFPQAWNTLMEFAIQSIGSVSGINDELRGVVDRDQPGIVEWQRKRAATALLAPLFDSLRRYHKEHGRLFLYMLGRYIPPNRAIRIVGKNQKPQIVQMSMMGDTAMYDVRVDEAPTSPNQKSEVWAFLEPALPTLINIGLPMPVWAELLRYSPLPESTTEQIISTLQDQAKQGPPPNPKVQQMQAEMEIAKQRAQQEMQLGQTKAALEAKSAQERAQLQQQIDQRQAEQTMQIEAMKAQHEAQLAQMKAELDARLEMQKTSAQMHLDAAKQDHAAQMEHMITTSKVDQAATEQYAKAWGGKGPDKIVDALKEMNEKHQKHLDAINDHIAKHGEALKAMHEDMKKPKRIKHSSGRTAIVEPG